MCLGCRVQGQRITGFKVKCQGTKGLGFRVSAQWKMCVGLKRFETDPRHIPISLKGALGCQEVGQGLRHAKPHTDPNQTHPKNPKASRLNTKSSNPKS